MRRSKRLFVLFLCLLFVFGCCPVALGADAAVTVGIEDVVAQVRGANYGISILNQQQVDSSASAAIQQQAEDTAQRADQLQQNVAVLQALWQSITAVVPDSEAQTKLQQELAAIFQGDIETLQQCVSALEQVKAALGEAGMTSTSLAAEHAANQIAYSAATLFLTDRLLQEHLNTLSEHEQSVQRQVSLLELFEQLGLTTSSSVTNARTFSVVLEAGTQALKNVLSTVDVQLAQLLNCDLQQLTLKKLSQYSTEELSQLSATISLVSSQYENAKTSNFELWQQQQRVNQSAGTVDAVLQQQQLDTLTEQHRQAYLVMTQNLQAAAEALATEQQAMDAAQRTYELAQLKLSVGIISAASFSTVCEAYADTRQMLCASYVAYYTSYFKLDAMNCGYWISF